MTVYNAKEDAELIRKEVERRGREGIPQLKEEICRGELRGVRLPAAQKVLRDKEREGKLMDFVEIKPRFWGVSFDVKKMYKLVVIKKYMK